MYRPTRLFSTPFMVLNPEIIKTNNRIVKTYPETGDIIMASFVTFGGSETINNGVITVMDTGQMELWYRPDIKSDTRLKRVSDGRVYEVIGDPENIEMRNQFLKFRVQSVRGSNG